MLELRLLESDADDCCHPVTDWRTKGVEPWAKTWFSERVTGVQVDGVEITDLTDTEGTAELGMRKSKLITVYDLRLTMAWKGEEPPSSWVSTNPAHEES